MGRKRASRTNAPVIGPELMPLHGGQFEYRIPREYKLPFGETKKDRPEGYFEELITTKVRWFVDMDKRIYFPWPEVALLLSKRPNAVARALAQLNLNDKASVMIQEWSVDKNKPTLQTMKALTRSGMMQMFKNAAALNDRGRKRGNWPGVDELRETVVHKWLPYLDALLASPDTMDAAFADKFAEYTIQIQSQPDALATPRRAPSRTKPRKRRRTNDDDTDDDHTNDDERGDTSDDNHSHNSQGEATADESDDGKSHSKSSSSSSSSSKASSSSSSSSSTLSSSMIASSSIGTNGHDVNNTDDGDHHDSKDNDHCDNKSAASPASTTSTISARNNTTTTRSSDDDSDHVPLANRRKRPSQSSSSGSPSSSTVASSRAIVASATKSRDACRTATRIVPSSSSSSSSSSFNNRDRVSSVVSSSPSSVASPAVAASTVHTTVRKRKSPYQPRATIAKISSPLPLPSLLPSSSSSQSSSGCLLSAESVCSAAAVEGEALEVDAVPIDTMIKLEHGGHTHIGSNNIPSSSSLSPSRHHHHHAPSSAHRVAQAYGSSSAQTVKSASAASAALPHHSASGNGMTQLAPSSSLPSFSEGGLPARVNYSPSALLAALALANTPYATTTSGTNNSNNNMWSSSSSASGPTNSNYINTSLPSSSSPSLYDFSSQAHTNLAWLQALHYLNLHQYAPIPSLLSTTTATVVNPSSSTASLGAAPTTVMPTSPASVSVSSDRSSSSNINTPFRDDHSDQHMAMLPSTSNSGSGSGGSGSAAAVNNINNNTTSMAMGGYTSTGLTILPASLPSSNASIPPSPSSASSISNVSSSSSAILYNHHREHEVDAHMDHHGHQL